MDTCPQGLEPHHRAARASQGVLSAKREEEVDHDYVAILQVFSISSISISGWSKMSPRTAESKETKAGKDGIENAISMFRVDR